MAAPDKVKKLVDDFERLKGGRIPDSFDEAQLRVSYVNPFWEALGWNVRDHREVVIEKVVPMRHSTKRADYCFLLNGRPAFVLETKDFRKHLDDPDIVFQLNRYGYNLRVDFGFLTNFAELQLYETWKTPLIENPVKNRVKKFHFDYQEYVERWGELEAALGREAVAAGALNEFLTKKEPTRNKEAVDRKFFEGLNEWRAELARVIALRNPDLTVHDINEAVQRILDRCIFMRVIEDRGIEATELLLDALHRWKDENEKTLYRYVVDKFRYLEPQYNGELFEKHFSEELLVDDKPLRDFIESLYYPKSPYQFNVVGVEMLGTVYERFLGSTIRLTKTHRAVVEEKPEVRKAGGVYYTPKYIVDYIVENTVGELLRKCKTPAAVAKLKILDPACGSGSFLLGAFQRLIDWHEDYFNANPEKVGKGLAAEAWRDDDEGRWRLTAKFKGRILVNNIFGVDIDPQACEVTRMSLYLKILESVNVQFLMKTALLPPLDNNIKCGNSLIGSDYFEGRLRPDEEELRRVNPFDWEVEFEEIMKAGGFDAVIGNPPYVAFYSKKAITLEGSYRRYYEKKYEFLKEYPQKSINTVMLFLERNISRVRPRGFQSLIIDIGFYESVYQPIRKYISQYAVKEILTNIEAFKGIKSGQIIITVMKAKPAKDFIQIKDGVTGVLNFIKYGVFASPTLVITKDFKTLDLLNRFENLPKLGDLVNITCGLEFGALRGLFISDARRNARYHRVVNGAKGIPSRYTLHWDGKYVLFDKEFEKKLIKEKRNYSKTGKYVYLISGDEKKYNEPKILMRQSAMRIICTYDDENYYALRSLFCLNKKNVYLGLKYISGILNSRIATIYATERGIIRYQKGKQPQIRIAGIEKLPIPDIDFSDRADVARHDKMVALVEEMLELHKRLAAAKADADKKRTQRAVDATDRKIDALVYELYGLTDEEIKIVES